MRKKSGSHQQQPARTGSTKLSGGSSPANCDALFNRAVAAGGKVPPGPMGQLSDHFWGDRTGSVIDPEGFLWTIATHKEDLTPDELKQRQAAFEKQFAATHG